MDEKQRMGLWAVMIGFGLFGSLAAILLANRPVDQVEVHVPVPVRDQVQREVAAPRPLQPPMAKSPAIDLSQDPLERIATHVWWKPTPSRSQVAAIIDRLTNMRFPEGFTVLRSGRIRQANDPKVRAKDALLFSAFLDCEDERRLTRREAIALLLGKLDRADFNPPSAFADD